MRGAAPGPKSSVKQHSVRITSLTAGLSEKRNIGVRANVKFAPVRNRSTENEEGYENNE